MARNPKTTYAEYDPKEKRTVHRKLTFTHVVQVPGLTPVPGLLIKFHCGMKGTPVRVTIDGEIPERREAAWFEPSWYQADATAAKRYAELHLTGKSDIQLNELPRLVPELSPTEKLKAENAELEAKAARLTEALEHVLATLRVIKGECAGQYPNPNRIRREVEDEYFLLESTYPELKGLL